MPKVLLVEDDNNLREIFEMRLKAEGYSTITAGDGEEALVVAMREKPDLIIADVMMPKLSGFEMLETLFTAPEMSNTKAIMMTALGAPEDRARGEKLGVIKYLVKSQVTLEDFVRVVREVLSPESGTKTTVPGAPAAQADNGPPTTNKGMEQSMPDDTSNNPSMPDAGATDPSSTGQPTTEQEQSTVNDQINNFVNTPPAGDSAGAAPGGDAGSGMGGSMPGSGSPTGDGMGSSPSSPTGMPGSDSSAGGMGTDTSAPQMPSATPPAEDAPQPPASSSDGSSSTPPAGNV